MIDPNQLHNQTNGRLPVIRECPVSNDHISKLSAAIDGLSQKVESLHTSQKEIIRYLLVVVCVIALGRTLIETLQTAFAHKSAQAQTLSKEK